jgi:hypothetical protein
MQKPGSGGKGAPSADSFGTFLESMQRQASTGNETNAEPLAILRVLKDKRVLKAPDLLAESRVNVFSFAESLRVMREAGLVSMGGPTGEETVQITPAGESVVSLALKSK